MTLFSPPEHSSQLSEDPLPKVTFRQPRAVLCTHVANVADDVHSPGIPASLQTRYREGIYGDGRVYQGVSRKVSREAGRPLLAQKQGERRARKGYL